MSLLALRLLGSPRVNLDKTTVKISRRKVMALLVYLAVSKQRHSRDELSEMLFGKRDRNRARASLRQTLSLLRSSIGSEHLGTDRLGVWITGTDELSSDVSEFQSLQKEWKASSARDSVLSGKKFLTAAAELYQGDFLSGFYLQDSSAFEDWQLMMQESLRRQQMTALHRLAEIHEATGQFEQAIEYLQKLLALDPLEEAAHRQLMRLFGSRGHRDEAVRQYHRCRRLLERELGEEPEEKTEHLYRQIISRKALPGTPMFLHAQLRIFGEERLKQQAHRFRDIVISEQGQVLSSAGNVLSAVFFESEAASKAALTVQDRFGTGGAEARLVLFAGESTHPQASPTRFDNRAREIFLYTAPGQLLLDEKAAELVGGEDLPEGMTLSPLGMRQHRGKERSQPLYLLERRDFTPASRQTAAPAGSPGNLKGLPTTFIGRKKELAAVLEMMRLPGIRLLTLTGAAGTGKTRLALQAAAKLQGSFQHGRFIVDLSVLNKPEHVIAAITEALSLREAGDNKQSLLETLVSFLKNKKMLLLLDNFEHLLPAVPRIALLLSECPRLKILATSREALHIQAERVFPVPPLEIPPRRQPSKSLRHFEAMMLFADRANAVQPAFNLYEKNEKIVAEICRRLDGLPLAILLAASHMGVLTPHLLLKKLKSRLNLLQGGPRDLPKRQQTLRSEIDWSYDLLDAEQRQIFRQLAVFSAGCTLDAAEAVCCPAGKEQDVFPVLSSLAEKNLIELAGEDGEARFRMLETIREYARVRLEENDNPAAAEERFAAYFLRFAEKAEPNLYGPEQAWWFNRIEKEYGNIRSALAWLSTRRKPEEGLRLSSALGWFWFRRARFSEGLYWLETFHDAAGDLTAPGPRAKNAYYIGWLKLCLSSVWGNPEGKRYFSESLRLWGKTGNRRGMALSQVWLGWKEGDIEDEEGWRIADESVAMARETEDPWAIAWCLKVAYSHLRRHDKDLNSRREALKESITLAREAGDPFLLSQALNGMGNVFSWVLELEAAEPWYLDSLRIAREIGDSWSILDNIFYLADGNIRRGRLDKARELLAEGLRLSLEYGARGYLGWFVGGFYNLACSEGRYKRALRLGAFSETILSPESRYDSSFAQRFGIDDRVAAQEWKLGQEMSAEDAAAYALMEE